MSDDVFRNRPADYALAAARAAISAVPLAGGPIVEFVNVVVAQPAQKRRDDFMKSIFDKVEALGARTDELKADNLASNEKFQASFIQGVAAALRTAEAAKREMLGNAVLNSARADVDETTRHIMMSLLDRLTVAHVRILRLFQNPMANSDVKKLVEGKVMGGSLREVVDVGVPELKGQKAIVERIVSDLEQLGLTNGTGLSVTMTGSGLGAKRTADLGDQFLSFIEPT